MVVTLVVVVVVAIVPWMLYNGMCSNGWHPAVLMTLAVLCCVKKTWECLPSERPAHARRATFVLSVSSPAPGLSSPTEVPHVDHTRPETFPTRHLG